METYDKLDQLRKLRLSANIVIAGNEITTSDDIKIYKKNALAYGKKLRGTYVNKDTGSIITLGKAGVKEVLQHDLTHQQLQSVAAIPLVIQHAIYIDCLDNEDKRKNPYVERFDYFVAGVIIGQQHFTVRAVIAIENNRARFYDHKLTNMEKGKLLDLSGLSSAGAALTQPHCPANQKSPSSNRKDKRLFNILQIIQ